MVFNARRWRMSLAALGALLVVAVVACGGDEEEEASPTGAATTTATVAGTATPEASPTEAVKVPGITDKEIKIGSHKPLSGPAASYGVIADGEKAYFDYVNEELGGVCGLKIVLITEDDAYTASRTVEVVRRLIEEEEVFAIFGGLGEATHGSVYRDLNEQGIPDMFVASGSQAWVDDPETYRYTFGGIPSYLTQEGPAMGEFIAENFPGAKVGFFGQNDDLGVQIEAGVRAGLAGRNEIVSVQTYATTAPDIRSQIINLRDAGTEVVAMAAIPEFAAFFMQSARAQDWDVPIVASGIIADLLVFDLAGKQNVTDVYIPGYLISPWLSRDVPAVQEYWRVMETYAPDLDASRSFRYYGYATAELMHEALKRACENNNLTRDGLVEAAESIRGWEQGVAWGPISLSPTDHAPYETFQWVVSDPEAAMWVNFGEIVDRETTPVE